MTKRYFTVRRKLAAVQYAKVPGVTKAHAARVFKIQRAQIRKWTKAEENLRAAMLRNPSARSLNRGRSVQDQQVEEGMYSWFLDLSSKEIQVKTKMFVQRALQDHPTFHGGDTKKLKNWVYKFLNRYNMSIRRITHKGQKLRTHLLEVRDDTAASIRSRFAEGGSLQGLDYRYFVNMDETAVYFESKSNTTVSKRGVKTVPARDSGSNSKRCTVCVAVAADGTKLPLFYVFKGAPNALIEKKN